MKSLSLFIMSDKIRNMSATKLFNFSLLSYLPLLVVSIVFACLLSNNPFMFLPNDVSTYYKYCNYYYLDLKISTVDQPLYASSGSFDFSSPCYYKVEIYPDGGGYHGWEPPEKNIVIRFDVVKNNKSYGYSRYNYWNGVYSLEYTSFDSITDTDARDALNNLMNNVINYINYENNKTAQSFTNMGLNRYFLEFCEEYVISASKLGAYKTASISGIIYSAIFVTIAAFLDVRYLVKLGYKKQILTTLGVLTAIAAVVGIIVLISVHNAWPAVIIIILLIIFFAGL